MEFGYSASLTGNFVESYDRTNLVSVDLIHYIAQSKAHRNKIVAVKLDRSYESPEELTGANASWAMAFTEGAILRALQS